MRCEGEGEHDDQLYFLTLTDSESHSNGVCVCRAHVLEALDSMLPNTASVDVQQVEGGQRP